MKYSITEENKTKAIKKNRLLMSLNYGGGIVIATYVLSDSPDSGPLVSTIYFISIILLAPFAWFYFDRKFRNRLTLTYEIDNEEIIITEKEKPVQTIPLNSIFSITKIAFGYRVVSKKGKFYVIGMVENITELINELNKQIN
jgi:hypothetical protein